MTISCLWATGFSYELPGTVDLVPYYHTTSFRLGGAFDWVKSKAGVKYAYTLECRPNTMNPGFLLPASGIIPSGEETWEGVKYVAQFILKTYGNK